MNPPYNLIPQNGHLGAAATFGRMNMPQGYPGGGLPSMTNVNVPQGFLKGIYPKKNVLGEVEEEQDMSKVANYLRSPFLDYNNHHLQGYLNPQTVQRQQFPTGQGFGKQGQWVDTRPNQKGQSQMQRAAEEKRIFGEVRPNTLTEYDNVMGSPTANAQGAYMNSYGVPTAQQWGGHVAALSDEIAFRKYGPSQGLTNPWHANGTTNGQPNAPILAAVQSQKRADALRESMRDQDIMATEPNTDPRVMYPGYNRKA
jgi:hypothetical protein